jgi:hypothetical protein
MNTSMRPDHLETGPVADVGEPRVAMPAEVALQDQTVLGAIEERAPLLELQHAIGRLLRVELGHAPVVEELAAAHGVAEVDLPVVLLPYVAQRRRDPALGHHGVRLPEKRLADERRLHAHRVRLDRRAQTGAARADHDDVVVVDLVFGHDQSLACGEETRSGLVDSLLADEPLVARFMSRRSTSSQPR